MIASAATHVGGWALALATIAFVCALAGFCTFVATKGSFEKAGARIPDWAAGLLAAVVALVIFFVGGWLIIALCVAGSRGARLVHRLVS